MKDELLNQIIADRDDRKSHAALANRLGEIERYLERATTAISADKKQSMLLEKVEILAELGNKQQAYKLARSSFDYFLANEQWQATVQACEIVYRYECEDAIAALGMACWLAITYPIDPLLSVRVLHYLIDETPDNSDAAAVAAVVAHYLVDLRTSGKQKDSLLFITKQKIADVALRHRNISDEESINIWMEILGLKDVKQFLPAMAKIIDVITADQWWFDRDQLRAQLPVH